MSEIFISYRREDTSGHATSIYEHLRGRFGVTAVFMDIGNVKAGSRWLEETQEQVDSCEVCIPIIGQRWRPERLEDKDDVVRLELETALNGNKGMIPVLVDGVDLPAINDLPPSLKDLLSWHAIWLDHRNYERFQHGLTTLQERIGTLLDQRGFVRPQGYSVVKLRIDDRRGWWSPDKYLNLGWTVFVNGTAVGSIQAEEERTLRVPAGMVEIGLKPRPAITDVLAPGKVVGSSLAGPVEATFMIDDDETMPIVLRWE